MLWISYAATCSSSIKLDENTTLTFWTLVCLWWKFSSQIRRIGSISFGRKNFITRVVLKRWECRLFLRSTHRVIVVQVINFTSICSLPKVLWWRKLKKQVWTIDVVWFIQGEKNYAMIDKKKEEKSCDKERLRKKQTFYIGIQNQARITKSFTSFILLL